MKPCEECGGTTVVEPDAVRGYAIGGLPHVALHGVRVIRCERCGAESVVIPKIAQLHRVLADLFVKQPRMLAPVEVRFLRKHVGMSTADFARAMGVARETVSRWESGSAPMGQVADRLLRLLVLTHEPAESYVVEDLLAELTGERPPRRLAPVAMQNSRTGWRPARLEPQPS